eukprot:m51a1_g9461 hypothetical protein (343) ;mRNA; r:525196-526879
MQAATMRAAGAVRASQSDATQGFDVLAAVPDDCLLFSVLPLLRARDLCCLSRTLDIRLVSDVALCSAALFVGTSLRSLSVKSCYQLSDASVLGIAVAGLRLECLALVRCPHVTGTGIEALARAYAPTLQHVRLEQLGVRSALPLCSLACDAMRDEDVLSAFADSQGAFSLLRQLRLNFLHHHRNTNAGEALRAIASACPALSNLEYNATLSKEAAEALVENCASLRRVKLFYGDADAFALLLRPSLESVSIKNNVSALFSQRLEQCSGALTELSLGCCEDEVTVTWELASSIVALRKLRRLHLSFSPMCMTGPEIALALSDDKRGDYGGAAGCKKREDDQPP